MSTEPAGNRRDDTEALRLRALWDLNILDSPPDAQFDAVCSLARSMFNVPTVLVSLVDDDRQWFKARCGYEPTETSRAVSFCDHAIHADSVLVVEDATRDPRFASNPLVTGDPGIRFYAGAPLTLSPGIRVGTICVIDLVPRAFSPDDRAKLQSFATIVVGLLRLHGANARQHKNLLEHAAREDLVDAQARELTRREAALREANRLLLLAEEMTQAGHWRIELPSRRRVWSPEVYRIFGRDPALGVPDLETLYACYHPDDRARVRGIITASIENAAPYSFEGRIVRPDGTERHIAIQGIAEATDGAPISSLFGVMIDITDQKRTEDQLRARERELSGVLDNMPALIGYIDRDRRVLLSNRTYGDWYGKTSDQIRGQHIRDVIGEEPYRLNSANMEAALRGERQHFERRIDTIIGQKRDLLATYVPDIRDGGSIPGFFVLIVDITDRKRVEDRLRASTAFQERAGRIAGVGAWEIDLASGAATMSGETARIYELGATETTYDHDAVLGLYAPEGRLRLDQAIDDCIRTGQPWDIEIPIITAKGRSVWVRSAGDVESLAGKPVRLFGVLQDISARRQAEAATREKEMQYRLLAENASDMIIRIDLTGMRLYVSPASVDLIGYQPSDLVGTRPRDSIHPDDVPRFDAMVAGLIAGTRDTDSITNRLRHRNGDWIWVEAKWRVLRDPKGHATEFVGSVRDVGARHQAEERLQASEALYRTLADSLPQMVWIVRAGDRTAIYRNDRFLTYYGMSGESRDDRVSHNHPDDVERMEAIWALAAENGQTYAVEGRLRRYDGVYRWHKVIATPIHRHGGVVEWLGTALDIDDIVTARQTLMETSELLSLSQEAAGAGFFDINLLTGGVVLSRESAAMHGYDGLTAITTDLEDWKTRVDPDDGSRILALVEEACLAGTTYSAEFRVLLGEGRSRWLHGIGRAQYNAAGRAVRMIGLNFDITERKAWETRLIDATAAAEVARREAEEASAAKSEFLASMSHEIRTPLNSIIGYTDLLLDDSHLRAGDRRRLELIQESGSALLTVVNDILDFSKIEAGQVELDPIPFSLPALLDNVLSMVSGFADRRNLTIHREMAADVPAMVKGDPNRLRQILLNLLNNAVKFTPEGTIHFKVVCDALEADRCGLLFTVTDTGIGISPDRRERLFQRFSQIDGSISRRFGGTGLGLAISKSLVDLMKGEIGVDSVEGRGSSFWFRIVLPVVRGQTVLGEPDASSRIDTRPARILLVEDVIVNQDLARSVLEAQGHHVDVASDGLEAIRKVQAGDFELVLMDVQMPGMDGLTATQHIRALDHPCKSIPIVAMTANVLPRQIEAFRAAGMDDHIGKPFKRVDLCATVARWTADGATTNRDAPATSALDRTILQDLTDMVGAALCHSLVTKFAAEIEQRFGSIPRPVDRDRLAADAHAMIAAAGSLGFTSFAALCREIETTCRNGGTLSSCLDRLEAARRLVIGDIATLALPVVDAAARPASRVATSIADRAASTHRTEAW